MWMLFQSPGLWIDPRAERLDRKNIWISERKRGWRPRRGPRRRKIHAIRLFSSDESSFDMGGSLSIKMKALLIWSRNHIEMSEYVSRMTRHLLLFWLLKRILTRIPILWPWKCLSTRYERAFCLLFSGFTGLSEPQRSNFRTIPFLYTISQVLLIWLACQS